jgi:hypothetical protein
MVPADEVAVLSSSVPLGQEEQAQLESKAVEAMKSLIAANKEIALLLATQSRHLMIIEVAIPLMLVLMLVFFYYQQMQLTVALAALHGHSR